MAIAYVSAQSTVGLGSSGVVSTFTLTLPSAISAGSALCIQAGGVPSAAAQTNWTITDNIAGSPNSYVFVDGIYDSYSSFEQSIYYALNIQSGPTSLVLHATSSNTFTYPALLVDVFTGVATASALDGEQDNVQTSISNDPGTGTNAITSGTFSPAHSGDLIWGVTVDVGGFGGDAPGTGFTQAQYDSTRSYLSEYKLSGASGSQACTFTNSTHGGDAGGAWLTSGMALRAATQNTTWYPPVRVRYVHGYSFLRRR